MSGFMSLYDAVDRIDLGGGFWVDVRQHITDAAHTVIQRALVDPRIEAVERGGETRVLTTTVDQGAYELARLVAHIDAWNITDRNGDPLPLPPYIQPTRPGVDEANKVRRQSIGFLPPFATRKILAKIVENDKRFADGVGPFPGTGDGAPA